MPQRPSKKVKSKPAKTPRAADGAGGIQGTQQRQRDDVTKAILAKFQGRKSI